MRVRIREKAVLQAVGTVQFLVLDILCCVLFMARQENEGESKERG